MRSQNLHFNHLTLIIIFIFLSVFSFGQTIKITTASCTGLGSITTLNYNIYAESLSGAVDYQFKFEEVGGASQVIEVKKSVVGPTTSNALNLTKVTAIKYNTTYKVSVRGTTDGTFDTESYGSYCTFTTPSTATKVMTTSCTVLNSMTSFNTVIYADPVIGAVDYQFKFEEVGGTGQVIEVEKSVVGPTTSNALSLLKVTALKYNTPYKVYVRATLDGTFDTEQYDTYCSFTTPSLVPIKITTASCDALHSLTTLNAIIYAETVGGSTDYQFKFEEVGGSGQIIEIKKSVVGPTTSNALNLSIVTGIKYNTQYNVYVKATIDGTFNDQAYGNYCTFTTPPLSPIKITTASCDSLSTITTINTVIYAEQVAGAIDYQFKFEDGENPAIEVKKSIVGPTTSNALNLLNVPNLQYSRTYFVSVKSTFDGSFTEQEYGESCLFTTPALAPIKVTTASCNTLGSMTTFNTVIYAEQVTGATDYQFKFEEVGGSAQIIEVKKSVVGPTTSNALNLSLVTGLKINKPYKVYVRATIGGTIENESYGDYCSFTTPPQPYTKITDASCAALSTITTLRMGIDCDAIPGATDYKFKFEEVGGTGQIIEVTKSALATSVSQCGWTIMYDPSLCNLYFVPGIKYNTIYKVYAKGTVDGTFEDANYRDYCTFTTPQPSTWLADASCSSLQTTTTLDMAVACEPILGATDYKFKFEEVGGTSQIIEFVKSVVGPTTSHELSLLRVPGIKYNTQYKIYVKATFDGSFDGVGIYNEENYNTTPCTFTAPSTLSNIKATSCSSLASITTLNTTIYAEAVIGAMDYQFKFEEVGGAGQIIEIKKSVVGPTTSNTLSLLKVTGIKYNTNYKIYVRATLDGTFDSEQYNNYCTFTTPVLSTKVMTSSCTTLNSMTTLNTVIYADQIVGALDYQFKFEEVGGSSQVLEVKKSVVGPTTSNALSLLKVTGLKLSTPYKVYVRATLDGTFDTEQYGEYCSFTTPSSAKNQTTSNPLTVVKENDLKFKIVAHPNPFNEETNIVIQSIDFETVTVFVLDISGRIVERFSTETNTNKSFGQTLLKGLYIVKVIDSRGNSQVIKLIKE